MTAGPLNGVRVVEMTMFQQGPVAGMRLGDLGADVIKIEAKTGDPARKFMSIIGAMSGLKGNNYYFEHTNRNKRSLVLDLKNEQDLAVLKGELLTYADVMIENFRPGVMDRLGLGQEKLRQVNPRLVTLSVTGFGATGPEAARTGYDQILQVEGGLMSFTGPSADEPTKVGVPIADIVAGMFGAFGVLAALREREQSGLGQQVGTSLLAGQIAIHSFQGTRWLIAGEIPEPAGNHHPTVCPYGMFRASDSPIIIAVGNDSIWERFAPLVGIDAQEARFARNRDRVRNRDALHTMLEAALPERRATEWLEVFAHHGVPAGDVRTLDRVYAGGQVRQQGLVCAVEHSTLGSIELPGPPLSFDRSSLADHRPPPTLGEHSEALRSELGAAARKRAT